MTDSKSSYKKFPSYPYFAFLPSVSTGMLDFLLPFPAKSSDKINNKPAEFTESHFVSLPVALLSLHKTSMALLTCISIKQKFLEWFRSVIDIKIFESVREVHEFFIQLF